MLSTERVITLAIQVDWIGFAEGTALDSRQALTLVGFNQTLVTTKELPFKWQSQIVIIASETEAGGGESESTASVSKQANGLLSVTMRDPSGTVIAAISNYLTVSRKHPEAPASIIAAILVVLDVKEYGRYEVEATIKEGSESPFTSRKLQYLHIFDEIEP